MKEKLKKILKTVELFILYFIRGSVALLMRYFSE